MNKGWLYLTILCMKAWSYPAGLALKSHSFATDFSPKLPSRESLVQQGTFPKAPLLVNSVDAFTLENIIFSGNSHINTSTLRATIKSFLNKKVTTHVLRTIAKRIRTFYRNKGYMLTQVQVPQQSFSKGIVMIQIWEGRIHSVVIEGASTQPFSSFIKEVTSMKAVNYKELETLISQVKETSGMRIEPMTFTQKTDEPGAFVLTVRVKKKSRLGGGISIGNGEGSSLGPWAINTQLHAHVGDKGKIYAQAVIPERPKDMQYYRAGYSHDLGYAQVLFQGSYLRMRPDAYTRGRDQQLLLRISKILTQSHKHAVEIYGGVHWHNFYGHDTSHRLKEATRMAFIGTSLKARLTDTSVSQMDIRYTYGFPGLGATAHSAKHKGRPGQASFSMVRFMLKHAQDIGKGFGFVALLQGQYSGQTLLSIEQFHLGGGPYYRGYPYAVRTGDSGIWGRLEVNYSVSPMALLYGYYGSGAVWDRVPVARRSTHLHNAGVGIKTQAVNGTQAFIEYAFPLKRKLEGTRYKGGISAGVSYQFD